MCVCEQGGGVFVCAYFVCVFVCVCKCVCVLGVMGRGGFLLVSAPGLH